MKELKTFEAKIYIGALNNATGNYMAESEVEQICQEYVDKTGWCVTFTKTTFIYTGGRERGYIIGIINYPRFPDSEENLRKKTLELAKLLLHRCHQLRCSVVFPDKTIFFDVITNEIGGKRQA